MDASLGRVVAVATAAFVATDVDDLALLVVLFLAAGRGERPGHREIVAGQYLGFAALLALGAAGAAGLALVPRAWARWVGLVPIAMGVWSLLRRGSVAAPVPLGMSLPGVIALTVACGADNVSVTVPLFHALRPADTLLACGVQFALLALWCGVAAAGARLLAAGSPLDRVRWLTPAACIVIGGAVVIGVGN